jgi:hypothetical protein
MKNIELRHFIKVLEAIRVKCENLIDWRLGKVAECLPA